MDLQKAIFLMDHDRLVEAEKELRGVLAHDPENGQALVLLTHCLLDMERYEDADEAARRAVAVDPMNPAAHFYLSRIFLINGDRAKALASAQQAVQLEPEEPEYLVALANVHADAKRFQESLEAVETALEIDSEHQGALNLRAMLLRQLRKTGQAGDALETALANRPDDPNTLANLGWHHIELGEWSQAKTSFLEALRLDPHNDWAKQGLAEVLKAKNLLYRTMLRFELWMDKLDGKHTWAIIIGGVLLNKALRGLARSEPDLEPFITPILIAYLIFVLLTWLHRALFNMVLMLQPQHRLLLDRGERAQGKAFGFMLLGGALSGIIYALTDYSPALIIAIWLAVLLIPLTKTVAVEQPAIARRLKYWLYPMCLLAVASVAAAILGIKAGVVLITLGVLMAVGFLWYYQFQILKGT